MPVVSATVLQRAQDAVQLLSLAVLLSSMFVFNQMGPIDEAALDRLSLVTQITKHVRVRATGPATGRDMQAGCSRTYQRFASSSSRASKGSTATGPATHAAVAHAVAAW